MKKCFGHILVTVEKVSQNLTPNKVNLHCQKFKFIKNIQQYFPQYFKLFFYSACGAFFMFLLLGPRTLLDFLDIELEMTSKFYAINVIKIVD